MIIDKHFAVFVAGSSAAKKRFPARRYKYMSSAKRRARQIHSAHDLGIETIWVIKY